MVFNLYKSFENAWKKENLFYRLFYNKSFAMRWFSEGAKESAESICNYIKSK